MPHNTFKGLLDTHVFIWLMQGEAQTISKNICHQIEQCAIKEGLFISAISLWEIAMLEAKGRIALSEMCLTWLQQALTTPGLKFAPLMPEIAVDSANLPDVFHGDPADRIIVATARYLNAKLFTRDDKILKYSKLGYLETVKV